MTLKLLIIPSPLHSSIAPRLRKCQLHRLTEEIKALDLINRLLRALYAVKDNKRLALSLQVRFRDNLKDLAIIGEQLGQRFFQLLHLDALFKVAHIYSRRRLAARCTCRSAMTRTLRLGEGRLPCWLLGCFNECRFRRLIWSIIYSESLGQLGSF
jgi:hypothetical protein